MRLRNVSGSRERIEESQFVVHNPEEMKGHWSKEVFGNDNPLRIEIGMGKGKFIMELAKLNPDINYVGIEKYTSVLIRAIEKQTEEELPNVRFLRFDAEYLCDIFEKGEVDRIYLNFSDPWPKDRHAKRRLTSRQFLARYEQVLKEDGIVEFKTDNRPLFEFSLEEYKVAGWKCIAHTFDLHNDEKLMQGNVMTEYEEKFSAAGNPINKMIITKG